MLTAEVFDRETLEAAIDTEWVGKNICYFNELDSTNIRAKLEAENGAAEGTLVVADMQTAGRGRRGRSWNSPAPPSPTSSGRTCCAARTCTSR